MGPSEEYDLAAIGPSGPYYDPYIYPYNSGSIGIGGSNLVIKISQPYPSSVFNNNSFHSTGEVFYFYPNNVDASGLTYTTIKLRIILSKIQLDALGAAYTTVNDEFINGSYMLPGGINDIFGGDIYLTDYTISGGSQLTILQDPLVRGWQNEDIIEYLKNTYYKSTSSKWIENLKTPRIAYDFLLGKKVSDTYDFKGGYSIAIKPGILVPSSSLIYSIVGENTEVKIILSAYDSLNIELATIQIILSENGDSGNSPDGMILTTNDTHEYTELGIVSIINNAINASSLAGNIILESSTSFSPYTLEYSTDFPGIRISLMDPVFSSSVIAYVKMYWSPEYIDFITSFNSLDGLELPFCSTTGSSFTGLPDEIFSFSSGVGLERGWTIGNQIA